MRVYKRNASLACQAVALKDSHLSLVTSDHFLILPSAFSFLYRPSRLAHEAVDADIAGTRDGVAYQSLHRADHQGGQRNLPEGLFVLLEIKRSAGMMTRGAISSLITSGKLLPCYFLPLTFLMSAVG